MVIKKKITEKPENKKKMRFLLGESMGGAVALLLHRKKPEYWDGAILAAPMCKVSLLSPFLCCYMLYKNIFGNILYVHHTLHTVLFVLYLLFHMKNESCVVSL